MSSSSVLVFSSGWLLNDASELLVGVEGAGFTSKTGFLC